MQLITPEPSRNSVCKTQSHRLWRDVMVNTKEVTSHEKKKERMSMRLVYGIHDTSFGKCLVGICEQGICHMSFFSSDSKSHMEVFHNTWPNPDNRRDEEGTRAMVRQVFSPTQNKSSEILLLGTRFQLRVWEKLLEVSEGDTISYSVLAEFIEEPNAVRAVSNAVANNPVAYIVPCHRIIGKDRSLHGYRWGLKVKKAILKHEEAFTVSLHKRLYSHCP